MKNFIQGSHVVVNGRGPGDKDYAGMVGVVLCFSGRGYARIHVTDAKNREHFLVEGELLVHPESLDVV